jgi:hypothetical protein
MKTIRIIFIAILALCCSQSNAQDLDFKTFSDIFPVRNYPFKLFYSDGSEFETPLSDIPEKLYEKYVFQKNYFVVKKYEQICFSGFLALGQFVTDKPYKLLLIAKDSEVSGCGEEDHLLTYTQEGEIIDILFVFGRGTNYKNVKENPFRVESVIALDSITVRRRETIGSLIKIGDKKYKSTFKAYNRVYHISPEGKFLLDKEEIKDEERYLD